jgi:hypothetical protein
MRRMLLLLFFTTFSISSAPHPQQEAPAPLEVRFTGPLRWENDCLRGALDIVNHSSGPLFLTSMGPYFYIALDVSKDDSQSGDDLEWVNIYGVTDIITMNANSLAAGSSVHRDFCFQPTVWVVNMRRKTRREIPVRGKLRVDVSYFAGEAEWKRYKDSSGHDTQRSSSPRLWSKAFAEIPCPKPTCVSDCNRPPVGIHGEGRLVPDVGEFIPEMNARGKELTEELLRKFPPCSGANKTPKEDGSIAN